MRYLSVVIVMFVFIFSCTNSNDEPVNLISPSGKLLAKSTKEIKQILVQTNNEIKNPDSIRLKQIFYDEEDSFIVAKVLYLYKGESHKALFYLNKTDSNPHQESLLENSKIKVFVHPNQPTVIVVTDKEQHHDTLRISTKFKFSPNDSNSNNKDTQAVPDTKI